MAISNKKKAGGVALLTVGSLALVGVGAGAAFTDTVEAKWTVQAGTADLDITSAHGFVISEDKNTAILAGPEVFSNANDGSARTITVTNNGDLTLPLDVTAAPSTGPEDLPLDVSVNGDGDWLKPGESKTVSIYVAPKDFNNGFTNADSGKTATVTIKVSGTI